MADMSERAINAVLAIVVFFTIVSSTVSLVLNAFDNLSASGIALGVLFSTVLGLVFAVGVFKGGKKIVDSIGK